MAGQSKVNMVGWSVKGNVAPTQLSKPTTTNVYTPTNTTLTLLTGVVVDGFVLNPVRMVPAW